MTDTLSNYLFDGLMLAVKANPKTIFLTLPSQCLSFGQLDELISKAANALLSLNVKPEQRVAIQIDKSLDGIIIYLACIKIGAVFLPLNTAYVAAEVMYFMEDASPSVFICSDDKYFELSQLLNSSAGLQQIQVINQGISENHSESAISDSGSDELIRESINWQILLQKQSSLSETLSRNADDLAAIIYTSGTTGRSKGAMLSHDNLLSNAKILLDVWQYKSSDVLLHALPIYHTHGLFVAINLSLLAGASMIFLKQFDCENICEQLPHSTVLMGVPTFYTRLLNHPHFNADICKNMRLFISGSAPLLAEDHQRFETLTGQVILERYGMTETSMNTSNPYSGERKAGTVGLALPNVDVRVSITATNDLNQQSEQDNNVGMIEVKGPNVFKGYWKMPEKTAEEFTDDGYFITGDLGTIDEQGYISIVGREKDLIISGGLNIYPKDVETVINTLQHVIESAVIGVADKDFGERGVAVVVCEQKCLADDASKCEQIKLIKQSLINKLAKFKHPREIYIVSELPRNAMGKVQKNKLRKDYSDSKNQFLKV